MDLQELSAKVRRYRLLIYGDEGIGKSSTALRLIRKRGLWLTADNTWSVADTPEFANRFDREPWETLSQIKELAERLKTDYTYDLLILDPTSTALGDALDKFVDKYPLGGQRARNLPEYGHYYMVMREAKGLVERVRNLPLDVIFICHSDDDKTPIRPNMNEKAAKAFYRECNLVAYMTREHGETRKITLQPSNRIKAKTQIPGIPEGVYPVDKFITLLMEWKNG